MPLEGRDLISKGNLTTEGILVDYEANHIFQMTIIVFH
jgi:hypothetical protein